MDVLAIIILTMLVFGTIILVICSAISITEYYSAGIFLYFTYGLYEEKFKSARIIGKIILVPLMAYTAVVEAIVAVLVTFCLTVFSLVKYMLNKDLSLKDAFKQTFGIISRQTSDNTTLHRFMGYCWKTTDEA